MGRDGTGLVEHTGAVTQAAVDVFARIRGSVGSAAVVRTSSTL